MKTNKSYSKRLKVSKNGKVRSRTPGQNHFNAKSGSKQRARRGQTKVFHITKRQARRFLSGI